MTTIIPSRRMVLATRFKAFTSSLEALDQELFKVKKHALSDACEPYATYVRELGQNGINNSTDPNINPITYQARNQNFIFARELFENNSHYELNYLEDYAIFQEMFAKVKNEDDDDIEVDKERNCCLMLKRVNYLIIRYIREEGFQTMNLSSKVADMKKIVANFNQAKDLFLHLFPKSKFELELELDLNSLLNSMLVYAFDFRKKTKKETEDKLQEIDMRHKKTLILTGKTCVGKVRKIINSIDEKVFYEVPYDIHHAFGVLKNSAKKKSVNLADERSSSIASTTMEEVVADFANLEADFASLGAKIKMVIAGNVDNGSRAEHDDDGKVIIWV